MFYCCFAVKSDEKNLAPLAGFQCDLMIIQKWLAFLGHPVYSVDLIRRTNLVVVGNAPLFIRLMLRWQNG